MSADTREGRSRAAPPVLYATEPQFADARPIEAVTAVIASPGCGYADRPNGLETETVTYCELWNRVGAVASALTNGSGHPVRSGDRVC